jgi:hypothetical protein
MKPRHYAAQILALTTREERREALSKVPSDYQERVKLYVENEFERRKYTRRP